MVAFVEQLGNRLPRYLAAFRAKRGDQRPDGDDMVLRDSDGHALGEVTGLRRKPEMGPHAPTMYLRRDS